MDEIFRLTRVDPVTGIAEPVPARERVDAILEHAQAPAIVRSLDPQALYSLIHEAGLNDAVELVLYAAPEQVQAIVDFDCWTRDSFEVERLTTWMEVLLQREDDAFGEMIDEMDPEPLVLWLREQMAVFFWEQDQDLLDTIDGPISSSPDGVYALLIPDDENVGPLIRHFLQRLYAKDIKLGHRFLEAVRWELNSNLQEEGYKHREARLGDLGFVPFHEALEVYAFVEPANWAARARSHALRTDAEPITLTESGTLPPVDHQLQVLETRRFAENSSTFTRALGTLPAAFEGHDLGPIIDAVTSQLRALVNRVHVADLGNPGDMAAARLSAERADANLSIGLELAAGDDITLAARVLGTAPLKEIHRAGYSATAKLALQAKRLEERGNLTLIDGQRSLLEPLDDELFAGLSRRRPLASGTYDTPFTSLSDVEAVARRLGEVAFLELIFFGTFRHTRDELAEMVFDPERCATEPDLVSFRSLFATRVVGELIKPGSELRPLPLAAVHQALGNFGTVGDAHSKLTSVGVRLVCDRVPDPRQLSGLATAYSARVAGWLLDEAGHFKKPMPIEIATQVLLIAP